MNIKEQGCVVLTQDLPAENLKLGDLGVVIHIHRGGLSHEVEFVSSATKTAVVVSLEAQYLRPICKQDAPSQKNGIWVPHTAHAIASEDVPGALAEE